MLKELLHSEAFGVDEGFATYEQQVGRKAGRPRQRKKHVTVGLRLATTTGQREFEQIKSPLGGQKRHCARFE